MKGISHHRRIHSDIPQQMGSDMLSTFEPENNQRATTTMMISRANDVVRKQGAKSPLLFRLKNQLNNLKEQTARVIGQDAANNIETTRKARRLGTQQHPSFLGRHTVPIKCFDKLQATSYKRINPQKQGSLQPHQSEKHGEQRQVPFYKRIKEVKSVVQESIENQGKLYHNNKTPHINYKSSKNIHKSTIGQTKPKAHERHCSQLRKEYQLSTTQLIQIIEIQKRQIAQLNQKLEGIEELQTQIKILSNEIVQGKIAKSQNVSLRQKIFKLDQEIKFIEERQSLKHQPQSPHIHARLKRLQYELVYLEQKLKTNQSEKFSLINQLRQKNDQCVRLMKQNYDTCLKLNQVQCQAENTKNAQNESLQKIRGKLQDARKMVIRLKQRGVSQQRNQLLKSSISTVQETKQYGLSSQLRKLQEECKIKDEVIITLKRQIDHMRSELQLNRGIQATINNLINLNKDMNDKIMGNGLKVINLKYHNLQFQ